LTDRGAAAVFSYFPLSGTMGAQAGM